MTTQATGGGNGQQYTMADLEVIRYEELGPDALLEFETWIHGFRPEPDGGERGYGLEGSLDWVYGQARFRKGYKGPNSELYGTFIFMLRETGKIVATGSITVDDRDTGRRNITGRNAIAANGFWGLVVVTRELRSLGLGGCVCAYLDSHIQQHVNETGDSLTFALFTAHPHAVDACVRVGFAYDQSITIPERNNSRKDLYLKRYQPDDEEYLVELMERGP